VVQLVGVPVEGIHGNLAQRDDQAVGVRFLQDPWQLGMGSQVGADRALQLVGRRAGRRIEGGILELVIEVVAQFAEPAPGGCTDLCLDRGFHGASPSVARRWRAVCLGLC
jgi:hypothetical protein